MKRIVSWWLCVFAVFTSSAIAAEAFPTRTVRIVVPYAAGTATDTLARTFAQQLGEAWGQPGVVENLLGANGTIATAGVAKAAPDGYTLLMIAANHVISASLYKSLSYDAVKDFRAIARIGEVPFVLCVNPSVPATTLAEFVALAKKQPGKINYVSPGNGTPGHLAMEMLKTASGIDVVHLPYKAAGQALTDLLGGQVQASFIVESSAIPQIKAGKLRALAISSTTRSAQLPDVPSLAETGYKGFEVVSWIGLAGPAKLPDDVVSAISAQVLRIVQLPAIRERIVAAGITVFPAGADEFGAYIAREHVKWAKAVKDSGATLD